VPKLRFTLILLVSLMGKIRLTAFSDICKCRAVVVRMGHQTFNDLPNFVRVTIPTSQLYILRNYVAETNAGFC